MRPFDFAKDIQAPIDEEDDGHGGGGGWPDLRRLPLGRLRPLALVVAGVVLDRSAVLSLPGMDATRAPKAPLSAFVPPMRATPRYGMASLRPIKMP